MKDCESALTIWLDNKRNNINNSNRIKYQLTSIHALLQRYKETLTEGRKSSQECKIKFHFSSVL